MFVPPNPAAYYETVWLIVRQIPPGTVSTYGQVASMIPPPEATTPDQYRRLRARWVGTALRHSLSTDHIPWQRVINAQGQISFPPGSSKAQEQRARLESEGVVFSQAGRVNLRVFGWRGPAEAWLTEQGLWPPLAFA